MQPYTDATKLKPMETWLSRCVLYSVLLACSGLIHAWDSKRRFLSQGHETESTALAAAHEHEIATLRMQIQEHENWERKLLADKADLQKRLAAAVSERDNLKLRAYPTESIFAAQRTVIFDRNNPFRQLDVRKECGIQDGVNLDQFLALASEIIRRQPEIDGLPPGASKAVLSMLLIGGIFDFGRDVPNDGGPGCISDSVRALKGPDYQIRFEDYQRATFGCCVDFSLLLIELLRYENICCELRSGPGHVFVEASLGESGTLLLDATFSLVIHGLDARATEQLQIYRFPVKDHARKVAKQLQIVFGLIFELKGMRAHDLVRLDYREFCKQYGIQLGGT